MAGGKTVRTGIKKGLVALLDKISDIRKPLAGSRAARAADRARARERLVSLRQQGTADISNRRVRELAQKDQASLQADRDTAAAALRRARAEGKAIGTNFNRPPDKHPSFFRIKGPPEGGQSRTHRYATQRLASDRSTRDTIQDRVYDLLSPGRTGGTRTAAQRRLDRATGRNAPQRRIGRDVRRGGR